MRGDGPDVWGIRKERKITNDLLMFSNTTLIAKTIEHTCHSLLLLSTSKDLELACQLQIATDKYFNIVQQHSPPIAPKYPIEWLEKKQMSHIQRFLDEKRSEPSYWEEAANGIQLWQHLRRESLM